VHNAHSTVRGVDVLTPLATCTTGLYP
jgi:hypothetical protein